jgi:hypothetical protein
MPRANRYFLHGYVWHITHRCHQKIFLLKFARDRRRYLHWLFEAKKRFGLCVLDYVVTYENIAFSAARCRLLSYDTCGLAQLRKSATIVISDVLEIREIWDVRCHSSPVTLKCFAGR